MTVQDLINAAMRLANIITAGEAPSSDESSDALSTLNMMLDSWSAERLMIPATPRTVLTLPANDTGSFQLGPGAADFPDVVRPIKIERAGFILATSATPVEIPLQIYTQAEWADVVIKYLPSSLPMGIRVDYTYPYITFYTWPNILVGGQIALYMWQPLAAFAALTDTLTLPPGYAEALQYNLAARLAVEYGQSPNQVMIQLALDLKDRIKNTNPEEYKMLTGLQRGGSRFNVYSGEVY